MDLLEVALVFRLINFLFIVFFGDITFMFSISLMAVFTFPLGEIVDNFFITRNWSVCSKY